MMTDSLSLFGVRTKATMAIVKRLTIDLKTVKISIAKCNITTRNSLDPNLYYQIHWQTSNQTMLSFEP